MTVTKREQQAYKLCHQDFKGLSVLKAAKRMGITRQRICQLLANLKKKEPQLFPILTQIQAKDYHLYVDQGWSMAEIAENTDRSVSTVSESIAAAVEKGMALPTKKNRMLRYKPDMDGQVQEKF